MIVSRLVEVVVVVVVAMELVVVVVRHSFKISSILKGLYDHADPVAGLEIILLCNDATGQW